MRINRVINIMGQELPVESVRTATEVKAMYEAAESLCETSYDFDSMPFYRGVQSAIAWMMKKRAPAPIDV